MAKELDDDPSEDDVQATDVGDDEQNKDEDDEEVLSQLVATRPLDLAQLSNRLLGEGHRANALLALIGGLMVRTLLANRSFRQLTLRLGASRLSRRRGSGLLISRASFLDRKSVV